ncbi:MAG TPA: lipid A deacylase LpxR family protein [Mucilaginibacter sp.]|nr:lipid A deacylase LpxR family protein [Mucilaginibacter sp.]
MNYKIFSFLLCFVCCGQAFAQSHRNEIGVETDDDSYLLNASDKYYTAGTFIYFRHALNVDGSASLQNKVLGFELGQKLYTPQTGNLNYFGFDDPRYIDRPFAGYLYAGANLNFLYNNESNLKISAQVGVVGPAAYGKQTQAFVHSLFGLYHTSGWEYQVDNDFEINLSAEYNRLLARGKWADISLASYANLGNGFTGVGIGPMLRLGDFNQLFNSESTKSTAIRSQKTAPLHDHELFFYYKPQVNFIAYDATIQGSMFNSKPANSMEVTGTPESFVLSNQFGVGYSGKRFVADIAVIFHSKDVGIMTNSDHWGAITLLYRFH